MSDFARLNALGGSRVVEVALDANRDEDASDEFKKEIA